VEVERLMNTSSIYGAFNARWLSPEDIARAFVPTAHFKALVKVQHSLLMGPRGCGKTTLLKMLTRPAQTVWWRERVQRAPKLAEYPTPDFEAIYVPSDIRWSYELGSISSELKEHTTIAETVQRAAVGISAFAEATRVFQRIFDDTGHASDRLLKGTITHLGLGPTVPSFAEVRLKLLSWAEEIHRLFVLRDPGRLLARVEALPPSITGHAADALTRACALFEEYAPDIAPKKWALCFDELEIAPRWLQKELLTSLRSVDQHILLKLTWSPILPSDLIEHQERQHDYAVIRMWHSRAAEARPFAQEYSTNLLRDRLQDDNIVPSDVFGASPFAQDDLSEDKGGDPYGEGSHIWRSMVSLAAKDRSFRDFLGESSLDPSNPTTSVSKVRDEVLRKVKPIVLLRDAYVREGPGYLFRRSRKQSDLYYGEDAIYAMSEGNPRMLAGLLNELVDSEIRIGDSRPRIRPETQSRVLSSASQRMLTGIRTYPVGSELPAASLSKLVHTLGRYLHTELVGETFNPDPVGSFLVDEDVPPELLDTISVGLLIGAFVYVGSTESDVPVSVLGSRIRLSYMLAPAYRVLFRTYRQLRLSTVLRVSASSQRSIFWSAQE
jgi:hypothetical protein